MLDPFWNSSGRRQDEGNWDFTLGREQYDWLERTLAQSKAKFKFVFAHNLVGGLDLDGRARGGIEGAPYGEWGGHNWDGSWGFEQQRPGWPMPIHHLLVKYNVTAFFHGHDHLYAHQELDGVTYQEVPQPSHGGARNPRGEYAYTHGDILPGSGYLRIHVAPDAVRSDYFRTDAGAPQLAHSYTMALREKNASRAATTEAGSRVDPAPKQDPNRPPRKGGRIGSERRRRMRTLRAALLLAVAAMSQTQPAFNGTVILGRPTNRSVVASVMSAEGGEVFIEYGTQAGSYGSTDGAWVAIAAGKPLEIALDKLKPNTHYFYRLRYRLAGAANTPRAKSTVSRRSVRLTPPSPSACRAIRTPNAPTACFTPISTRARSTTSAATGRIST